MYNTFYERFRRFLAQEHHRELGRKLGMEAKAKGITEEQLIDDLDKDRQVVYEDLYGKQHQQTAGVAHSPNR